MSGDSGRWRCRKNEDEAATVRSSHIPCEPRANPSRSPRSAIRLAARTDARGLRPVMAYTKIFRARLHANTRPAYPGTLDHPERLCTIMQALMGSRVDGISLRDCLKVGNGLRSFNIVYSQQCRRAVGAIYDLRGPWMSKAENRSPLRSCVTSVSEDS